MITDATVVVPMFNEAAAIAPVVASLRAHFKHIVCVDDGSADACATLARDAGAVVVRHGVNLGQGAALQTGFEYALRRPECDFVITFDGDGQHHANDAVAMLGRARAEELDVVLGSRNLGATSGQPLTRRLVLPLGTARLPARRGSRESQKAVKRGGHASIMP